MNRCRIYVVAHTAWCNTSVLVFMVMQMVSTKPTATTRLSVPKAQLPLRKAKTTNYSFGVLPFPSATCATIQSPTSFWNTGLVSGKSACS